MTGLPVLAWVEDGACDLNIDKEVLLSLYEE